MVYFELLLQTVYSELLLQVVYFKLLLRAARTELLSQTPAGLLQKVTPHLDFYENQTPTELL